MEGSKVGHGWADNSAFKQSENHLGKYERGKLLFRIGGGRIILQKILRRRMDGLLNGISQLSFLESFPRMNNFFENSRIGHVSPAFDFPRNLLSSFPLTLSIKRIITRTFDLKQRKYVILVLARSRKEEEVDQKRKKSWIKFRDKHEIELRNRGGGEE